MTEAKIMVLLALGPLLWMAGGTWWKPARRFVWPICAGMACFGLLPAWRVVSYVLSLMVVNSLGYGEKDTLLERAGIFLGLGLPVVFIHPVIGVVGSVITLLLLSALFWTSRRFNRVTWKVWEGLAGFLQAALLVVVVALM